MKVCIMCGGEGTRLRPLTFERPKPCIPIVNRPSVQHLVSHLSNLGFREVVMTLGYMGKDIEMALGDGPYLALILPMSMKRQSLALQVVSGMPKNILMGRIFL